MTRHALDIALLGIDSHLPIVDEQERSVPPQVDQ